MVIVVITDYRFPEGCAFVHRMHTPRFYIHYYLRINMSSNNLLYLIDGWKCNVRKRTVCPFLDIDWICILLIISCIMFWHIFCIL